MKTMFLMFLLCGATLLNASAQEKIYKIDEVSVINYGDGRLLYRHRDQDKTPLQGEHRIIDGYRSEYFIANFKDGMYDGLYRYYKNNVLMIESTYKNGNFDGYRKAYYPDGKTLAQESTFIDGKMNGIIKSYHRNGQVETEVSYKMGVQDGPDRRYSEDGTLREEGRCENDTEVYRKEYYDNGKLKAVAERPNGSGSWTTLERYDRNGNKQ